MVAARSIYIARVTRSEWSADDETAAAGAGGSIPGVVAGGVHGGLVPGMMLGRYSLLRIVGAGGMGVVYEAYDPELDRPVAVKVLREAGAGRRERLVREAQALARISHPHVLVVHEAAVQGELAYIVTELVDGQHLGEWLAARPRSLDEKLDAFAAAGQGLAAAHKVGLVHRDFKPSNALIGHDGRVRVADFGIVRAALEPDDTGGGAAAAHPESTLTRTGSAIGTPAYMAPEQARGEAADARADQYSFCVALHEALAGHRPHLDPVTGVRVAAGVPQGLRRVLERGLELEPARRFPSMPALLDALAEARARPRRRRRAAVLVASVAAAIALALTASALRTGDTPLLSTCDAQDASLAGVWDDAVRARAQAAFLATGLPFAAGSWARTQDTLDRWALRWQAGRHDACAATHERHEQSEALLDLRMRCLDRRRLELERFAAALARADAKTVGRSVDASAALASPGLCADTETLAARTPRPTDAATTAKLTPIEQLLADGGAQLAAGHPQLGLPIAEQAAALARTAGWAPLLAEALLLEGRLRSAADQFEPAVAPLREAVIWGDAAGDDKLRFDALLRLIGVEGYFLERAERTVELAAQARAIIARLGGDERLLAELDEQLANADLRTGQLTRARGYADEMLAIRLRLYPTGDPIFGRTYLLFARVTQIQGELDLSMEYVERGRVLEEARLGAQHPELARYWHVIGITHQVRGELALAEQAIRRTLMIDGQLRGPETERSARTYNNLAKVLHKLGRHDEARAIFAQVIATHERAVGKDSLVVADSTTSLADLLLDMGRLDDAAAHAQRALRIYRTQPTHDGAAYPLLVLSLIESRRGHAREALALAVEAVGILERSLGKDDATLATPLCIRGAALGALGRTGEARADFQRALAMFDARPGDPADRARAERGLAAYPAPTPSRSSQR